MTLYYVIRYRYAKNWLLVLSKINVGISVLAITSVALYIHLTTKDSLKNGNGNGVNRYI